MKNFLNQNSEHYLTDILWSIALGPLAEALTYKSKSVSHILLELLVYELEAYASESVDDPYWVPYRKALPLVKQALVGFVKEHRRRK